MSADKILLTIGAVALSVIFTLYMARTESPKQRACASYRDLMSAAAENGNDSSYRSDEVESLCGGAE